MTTIDDIVRDCWGTIGIVAMGFYEELQLPSGYHHRLTYSKIAYPGIELFDGDPTEASPMVPTMVGTIYFYRDHVLFSCWKPLPSLTICEITPHYIKIEYAYPQLFEKIQQLVTACCK